MPKISYINEPWIQITNIDLLSPEILSDFEGLAIKYAKKGFSIGDLVRKGKVKYEIHGLDSISFQFEGMETSITEVFRADFNNDNTSLNFCLFITQKGIKFF